jgi:endonuclease YncB( thermonuclease family)
MFFFALTLQALVLSITDGDTITVQAGSGVESVRIENIDTPEMPPKAKCASEEARALAAKAAMEALAPPGSVVVLHIGKRQRDRYGRLLARIELPGGADAGQMLIDTGLARPWRGKRMSWCALSN